MIKTLHVSDICRKARVAEQTGDYETGLRVLADFWDYREPDRDPNLPESITEESAELLLRCGILYGFYGYFYSVSGYQKYQDKSLDLLTRAFMGYQQLGLKEFRYEQRLCAVYLATAYSRYPNQENTETWLRFALSSQEIDWAYLQALILESNVLIKVKENETAIERLNSFTSFFLNSSDLLLKGNYFNNLGIALKNMGDFERARENLTKGCEIFKKLGHKINLIASLNNIALLHHRKGLASLSSIRPKHDLLNKVFQYLSQALGIAEELGLSRQIGDVLDSHAIVAFDTENFALALYYAEKAVSHLEKTEAFGTLVSAMETRMKCLIRLGRLVDALEDYKKASGIAEIHLDSYYLSGLTGAFVSQTHETRIIKLYREGDYMTFLSDVSLIFPPGMHFEEEISIIQATTNRSRFLGVEAGDYLVVEASAVQEGDLVAILHPNGTVFTGIFHIDQIHQKIFLRSPEGVEWLDFNIRPGNDRSSKLGKIVGKTGFKKHLSKQLFVEPIDYRPDDEYEN